MYNITQVTGVNIVITLFKAYTPFRLIKKILTVLPGLY